MAAAPASLTKYREKRDFSQTPEPAGDAVGSGQTLSFVVQRHAARRLHYDFRLEWAGVMKSWAVTRGPSLDPADRRLAVEVEDHPLDYAGFEGTIPKPSYGAGTVQVWDRGVWAPLDPNTVDQDLARGELKFVLSGERLNGGFVLVRMHPRHGETERHHNWLLIKERDSAATPGAGDAVLNAKTSVLSGRTMDEITAGAEPKMTPAMTPRSEKQSARSGSENAAQVPTAGRKIGGRAVERALRTALKPASHSATQQPNTTTPHQKTAKQSRETGQRPRTAKREPRKSAAEPLNAETPKSRTLPLKTGKSATPSRKLASDPRNAATKTASKQSVAIPVAERPARNLGAKRPAKTAIAPSPAMRAQVPGAIPPKSRAANAAIPRFVAPQLCKLVETPPTSAAWVHELKLDGYRLQLRVEAGKPVLRTRTGLDWTDRFPAIAQSAAGLPDCLMDGEAVALDARGHPNFSALQATLAGEQTAPIVYYAFDLLHDGKRDLRDDTLATRKDLLRAIVPEKDPVMRYLDHFGGPGQAVLASACELAMEGIVSKRVDSHYSSGRGDLWTKSKCRGRDEFLVGGWTKGKNGRGLGALLVGAHRDGNLVYLGRVGTGFNATRSDDLMRRLNDSRIAVSPFSGRQPARTSDVIWVRPKTVVEVAYGGWTAGEGLLRHASFQGVREDKPPEAVTPPETPARTPAPETPTPWTSDVSTSRAAGPVSPAAAPETTLAASAGTRMARSDTASSPPPSPHPAGTLSISHPDRVLWPATATTPAVTKADLAGYYARYADRILAQAGGRPLSVIRAPGGIAGELFFQRHAMRGQSPLIGLVKVAGQAQPYLRVDDAPGLAALAQISVVELHPWGARADRPEVPDRLIFDLDPAEGLKFDAVIHAALELRERLKALRLTSFARVTGGKGLHVVVPLAAAKSATPPGWPEAKQFARLICVMMEHDAPNQYTTTMAKVVRAGKIFLDYLRNDRTSTAIAGWSPRGRPGAPVAVPVEWEAVKPGLNPAGWNVPGLLAEEMPPDPWANFNSAGGDLRAAIVKATKV